MLQQSDMELVVSLVYLSCYLVVLTTGCIAIKTYAVLPDESQPNKWSLLLGSCRSSVSVKDMASVRRKGYALIWPLHHIASSA